MTVALSFVFFMAGTLFVWIGQPFGRLAPGAPTALGLILFGGATPLFLFRGPIRLEITVRNPRRYLVVSLALLAATAFWLFIVVRRFGPSAALYVLRRQIPPASVLQGLYREQLPLRAFWPPLMLSLSVSVLLVAEARRKIWPIPLVLISLFCFVAVYETRHILIWLVLYYLVHKAMHIKQLVRLFRPRLLSAIAIGMAAFVVLGDIRSGVSTGESTRFAEAMAVAPKYSHLPITVEWALIYSFSGFARGMANDDFIRVGAMRIPAKVAPGVLQRTGLFAPEPTMSVRYSDQAFAIDAWHTYGLEFGLMGAFVLTVLILAALHVTLVHVRRSLQESGRLSCAAYAFVLWLSVRVVLLPIGDYILDFGALIELTTLIIMLQISGAVMQDREDGASVAHP